jgi:hypothetical protein
MTNPSIAWQMQYMIETEAFSEVTIVSAAA